MAVTSRESNIYRWKLECDERLAHHVEARIMMRCDGNHFEFIAPQLFKKETISPTIQNFDIL